MLIPAYVTDPAVRKRIGIEVRIVRKLIRTMKQHGWDVYAVNDGEEIHHSLKTEKAAMEHAFAVDEAAIYFENKKLIRTNGEGTQSHPCHHVYLVFGNDGWDVIADWSYSDDDNFNIIMDEIISPYTDAIADKYC